MPTYLITGSNGLLGQKLAYALLQRPEIQIIALSRGQNRLVTQSGYSYCSVDLCNRSQVLKTFSSHKPDVVIHTAAMTQVDACEQDRVACWANNVEATANVIAGCESVGAQLVHVSTDFVFDGLNGPYSETDMPKPISYYGESKLAAELLVQQTKVSWAIARTVLVYGVTDNMSRSNVVLWAINALRKAEPINVVNDQWRTPTLAEDLAAGCIAIADKRATGIFHLSGSDTMSVFQLVERVAAHFQLDTGCMSPIASADLNQPAKRPPTTGFVIDKAVEELRYQPHTFEAGLSIVKAQLGAFEAPM